MYPTVLCSTVRGRQASARPLISTARRCHNHGYRVAFARYFLLRGVLLLTTIKCEVFCKKSLKIEYLRTLFSVVRRGDDVYTLAVQQLTCYRNRYIWYIQYIYHTSMRDIHVHRVGSTLLLLVVRALVSFYQEINTVTRIDTINLLTTPALPYSLPSYLHM